MAHGTVPGGWSLYWTSDPVIFSSEKVNEQTIKYLKKKKKFREIILEERKGLDQWLKKRKKEVFPPKIQNLLCFKHRKSLKDYLIWRPNWI